MSKKILLTGGAGYIGSHVWCKLLERNDEVVVVDNFSNSSRTVPETVARLTGKKTHWFEVDLLDLEALIEVFEDSGPFDAVLHFAALKAVGESMSKPHLYYHNNVVGSLNLVAAMLQNGCKQLVFSSSATVYGEPESLPYTETHRIQPNNVYGWTKSMMEQVFADMAEAEEWHVSLLRYFNPVGAHPSGQLGESPTQPNNLMPYLCQVAVGWRESLAIFGEDYDTPDGTGVRDYLHVMDLAEAHLCALDALGSWPGCRAHNLGTGRGTSVRELVAAFEKANGVKIPCRVEPRREGDLASSWADPQRAKLELGWQADLGVEAMVADSWRWQQTWAKREEAQ